MKFFFINQAKSTDTRSGFLSLLSLAFLFLSPALYGQNPIFEGTEWEVLFNSKDLSGWIEIGSEEWSVDEGSILGESGAGGDRFLATERDFRNFELHVRFKVEGPGNSGVFYHTTFEDGKFANGIQIEVDGRLNRHTGGIHEPYGRGWVAWPTPRNESVIRPDDWNDLLIRVEANHVITRLNGVEMVNFTDPRPKNRVGKIALQVHPGGGSRIRFKDVWIRVLPE
ncbi:MAG TPA: DUF1080 domain-containing protein [Acidobacteriota bacterium]|nr:DUF1080 domain-containing protein [Acidobacteriota bacterium]